MKTPRTGKGGAGGHAEVVGDDSTAHGGDGGEGVIGDGGLGGNAAVRGDRSGAIGGKGGRGGLGPGQPGADIEVDGDNAFGAGGQGGEGYQIDGRGGRGGRAHGMELLGLERRHMRLPYGEPNNEFGRGGDGADTTQYKARRLIIEDMKRRFFRRRSLPEQTVHEIWYDREIVSVEHLNHQLGQDGHRWRVTIVDGEYEFTDVSRAPAAGE
jgi:hypothetical protein